MKNLNTFFKIAAFSFILAVIISGCLDNTDSNVVNPYEKEAVLMKTWLDSMVANGKDIDTTANGIFYIIEKVGSGPTVKAKDAVTVKYTGMLLDGTIFDSSISSNEKGTWMYEHQVDPLIQGWEEGIELLSKGGKAIFLIPSILGYGSEGSKKIPPYTPLIFIIEVVDIK